MYYDMVYAFCLYFSILIGIGIYFYSRNKSQAQFSLANRSLNFWVTAISAQASDMSDWLFMAYPGAIFISGLSSIWIAVGLVLFMFLTWQFIAPQIRVQTEQYNALTLSSFLHNKYNDHSNMIKIISGLFCLYFFTFYIAAGLVGLGRVFEIAFDINYHTGIIIGLTISLLYTLLGGLLAIAWGDLIQGTFLLLCILLVPYYAAAQLGGFHNVLDHIHMFGPEYLSIYPQSSFIATIIAIMSWGLGYFGQPHILINFMGIDSADNISKSKIVGITWQILALLGAICIGLVGKVMFLNTLDNPELVFIIMVKQLFNPFFAGLILCAIFAATISTINIQALISSSLITQDLYLPISKTNNKSSMLFFSRLAVFIIPLLSLIIAFNDTSSVQKLVLYGWSGLGTCFGPIVILTLYTNWLNRHGVLAGILAGGITATFWHIIQQSSPLAESIPTLIIGFVINSLVSIIISQITKK